MALNDAKARIMSHLSAHSDTWASTISKVSDEVGSQFFTEQAMKELVEAGHVIRCSDSRIPRYQAPGKIDGKYSGFNDKRLDQWPKPGGPYDYEPWLKPLTPKTGA